MAVTTTAWLSGSIFMNSKKRILLQINGTFFVIILSHK